MRTYIYKSLKTVSDWLRLWVISGKKILTAREAALYLKTDVVTIYRLKANYYLPFYKTPKMTLYFKRKEIDTWLKPRCRGHLPHNLRKVNKPQETGVVTQND